MKVLCVICSGPILMIDVDGVYRRGEQDTHLDKTLRSNLIIIMV